MSQGTIHTYALLNIELYVYLAYGQCKSWWDLQQSRLFRENGYLDTNVITICKIYSQAKVSFVQLYLYNMWLIILVIQLTIIYYIHKVHI